jgi:alpha,alpha-trehalase
MKYITSVFLILLLNICVDGYKPKPALKKPSNYIVQPTSFRTQSCTSRIYCNGDVLHKIQMAHVYPDSKTFVDMPSKSSESQVLDNFKNLANDSTRQDVEKFLDENFHKVGFEVQTAEPADWDDNPSYLCNIKDKTFLEFGKTLNTKWKSLLRIFNRSGLCENCASSAIITNHSFVVPGGRFIEYYYWDTYFIFEALLSSKMLSTARGILANFLDIVEINGFVPNGARVYYLYRSQPPLLTHMFKAYVDATADYAFLKSKIELLDQEYAFWMYERAVEYEKNGRKYTLNAYNVSTVIPRPESYREDYLNGEKTSDPVLYYSNVMSAAESGWDFSSRWFLNPMDIKTIVITDMIPVDLNAILYRNEKLLAEFHSLFGNKEKSEFYESQMKYRESAINELLWDDELNTYADLNIKSGELHTEYLYASDLAPLWVGITPPVKPELILNRYKSLIMDHVSGIPVSNIKTGEQWDFPNVWAPYNFWLVEYLNKMGKTDIALNIAQRFVNTVYCGWKKTGFIYEKYDAERLGEYGGGGEYIVQEGFGWTNGVVIKFMEWFGKELSSANLECARVNATSANMTSFAAGFKENSVAVYYIVPVLLIINFIIISLLFKY